MTEFVCQSCQRKHKTALSHTDRLLGLVVNDLATNEELDSDDLTCAHALRTVSNDSNIIQIADRIEANNIVGVRLGRKNRYELQAIGRKIWTPNTIA